MTKKNVGLEKAISEDIHAKYKTKLINRMNVFGQMKRLEQEYEKGKLVLIELDSALRTMQELNKEINHEAVVAEIKAEYEDQKKKETKAVVEETKVKEETK